MDAILAILVLGAVIFFGALISAGNERQRKALDGIREQATLWAKQDLRLKREKLSRDVKIDDPLAWLNQVVAKVYGENLGLVVIEVFDNPKALVCTAKDGRKVVFSPTHPEDIQRMNRNAKSKVSKFGNVHPLRSIFPKIEPIEMNILNSGIFFDLEFAFVWKIISGADVDNPNSLWGYIY